ncbi:MAG: hypothetical protein ACRCZI_01470 [Cetobacterium sp.]
MDEDDDRRQPKQLGDAQWEFVKKVRGAIKKDHVAFFGQHHWKHIVPGSGSYDSHLLNKCNQTTNKVQDFYVKPIACWVPHLLIKNHVPTCPRCQSKEFVHTQRARFINSPIILFGMSTNKYLDTCLYPCDKCSKSFTGYNKQSMQLDAPVYFAYFNFYLGPGYAVDEQLYSHVIEEAASQATAMIARRLKTHAYKRYYSDYQLYFAAAGVHKISQPKKKQKNIKDLFPKISNDPALEGLKRMKRDALDECGRARAALDNARRDLEKDIRFDGMLGDKDNHNIHGRFNLLVGLGGTKLRRLIAAGVFSMHGLMAVHNDDQSIVDAGLSNLVIGWQSKVVAYYEQLQGTVDFERERLEAADHCLAIATADLDSYIDECNRDKIVLPAQRGSSINPYRKRDSETLPPLFSEFDDKKGYNGRILSKGRIDSIVTTVFNSRKRFQEAKMKGLCATILKIDFNYKLAHKVRVWVAKGESFVPFKCVTTIQNEDALTVFWKALKHSESFKEIADDLRRLRLRLNRNKAAAEGNIIVTDDQLPEAVKVVYVDNCCQVRRSINNIFFEALVKLDSFHWLKRWNPIVFDPKSAHAGILRALLTSALHNVDAVEFARAKAKLEAKKKRAPTIKEVLKEAKSVIPQPNILRSNIEAVLMYVQEKDAETEHILSTWQDGVNTGPKPQRFFKHNGVREVIRNQLKHVDRGCLSDPPTETVNLFRHNPRKDITYVARGTNTNERDNWDLGNSILSATHIGKCHFASVSVDSHMSHIL